jgi:membrane protein DedA with SNARE-associated domain
LEHLIQNYGYYALFIGTFLEGETILIIAGIACAHGLMELDRTILSAFLGSVAGDQLHFLIARYKGAWILSKFPRRRERILKGLAVVERHSIWLVLVFRFMYGLRNVTAFALGMTRMPIWLFTPLNAIGAAVWAVCFAVGGLVFGYPLFLLLGKVRHFQFVLLGVLSIAALVFWLYRIQKARRAATQNSVSRLKNAAVHESAALPLRGTVADK